MFELRARKRTTGGLLAIGALAVATVLVPATAPPAPAAAPPAQTAAVPCPTTGVPGTDVTSWDQTFSQRGITMCEGFAGPSNVVKVQIIDIAAGAGLGHGTGPWTQAPNPKDSLLGRKYLPTWADEVNIGAPAAGGYFSVTNASFFTDTSSQNTKLSFPVKRQGFNISYGVAIDGTDPNSDTPKKVLRFDRFGEIVQIDHFPTNYSASDAQCSGWEECIVGLVPYADPGGDPNRTDSRTFVGVNTGVGVNATRVYILTGSLMTVTEARDILHHCGAVNTMQLDGGGSTGMQSYAGHWLQAPLSRAVPNILATTYGAP